MCLILGRLFDLGLKTGKYDYYYPDGKKKL